MSRDTEAYAYVKSYYGVNPQIGAHVTMKVSGKAGIIVRKRTYDHYVHVKFDGRNFDVPVHPLDLEYSHADTIKQHDPEVK